MNIPKMLLLLVVVVVVLPYNNIDWNIFEPSEVEVVLGSKKSPGPDKIRNEILKGGIHYLMKSPF